jgi:thiol:disulfide interchange protein
MRSCFGKFWLFISIGSFLKSEKRATSPYWCLVLIFLWTLATHPEPSLAGALAVPTGSNAEPELLEPERAFQLSAWLKDTKTVELQYKIADGYFLYRSRFKFAIESGSSTKLGRAKLPKGKLKLDPTFGRVETYRNSVRILLPIASLNKSQESVDSHVLRLKITSQGCADAGVCYPPLHQSLTLQPGNSGIVVADRTASVGSLNERLQTNPENQAKSLGNELRTTK